MSSTAKKNFQVGSILPIYKEDAELFFQIIEAVCELGFHFSVLAEGDRNVLKKLFQYAEKYPENMEVLESIDQNRDKILLQSKVVLFLDTPNKKTLGDILIKGSVPIIGEDKTFKNFDAQSEAGNAFTFKNKNIWNIMSALVRASENSKFSYDWKNLQSNIAKLIVMLEKREKK